MFYNGVAERYGVMGFHLISPFTRAAQSLLRVRGVAICAPTMDSTADLIDFIYKRAARELGSGESVSLHKREFLIPGKISVKPKNPLNHSKQT